MLEVTDNHMIVQDVWRSSPQEILAFDALVLVTQRNSDNALYRDLLSNKDRWAAGGIEQVFRIGDCVAPGLIADAVFDGHRLAREIDTSDPETPLPFIRERRVVADNEPLPV